MSSFGSGAFGAGAFGAGGASAPSPLELLSDSVAMTTAPVGYWGGMRELTGALGIADVTDPTEIRANLDEALTVTGTNLGIDLPNLIDRINASGSATGYATLRNQISEAMGFGDTMQVAWALLLQENLALAGAAVGNPFLLGALVDTLHASGLAQSRLDAVAAISAALAMESLVANGWSVAAIDNVIFNEALTNAARFIAPLVDSAALGDAASNSLRLVVLASDALIGATDASGLLAMTAEARDGIVLYATVNLGGTEYSGWALNTANKAASEYTNYPFESLVAFNGRAFGAGEGGLYELTGETDDGEAIAAHLATGLLDFGTIHQKRIPDMYYGITGAGRIALKVVHTSDNGERTEDWYLSDPDARTGTGPREGHIDIGRGIKSRLLGFSLHNQAGGTLDLSAIALRRIILDRRK